MYTEMKSEMVETSFKCMSCLNKENIRQKSHHSILVCYKVHLSSSLEDR